MVESGQWTMLPESWIPILHEDQPSMTPFAGSRRLRLILRFPLRLSAPRKTGSQPATHARSIPRVGLSRTSRM